MRGTTQYWGQRAKELRSLVQFKINEGKGLPSFFTTGSCAEFHFKPLKRLLSMYISQTTGSSVDLNDKNILFKTLQENTHIVGQYFDLRTQSYFKNVMGPVFGVDSYWYRQEFAKSRGMVHWHGLCWRSDRELICCTKPSQLVFLKKNVPINCPSGLVRILVLLLIILLARMKLVVQTKICGLLQKVLLPHLQKKITPFSNF